MFLHRTWSGGTPRASSPTWFERCLYNVKININSDVGEKRAVEGASPYILFRQIRCAAKSLRSLRIYILLRDRENGADFVLRYYIYIKHNFCVLFLIKSAPSRLSPIEALPQTPQWALPLDPTSPLAPGLSVRFISRFARCLGAALLIPHS